MAKRVEVEPGAQIRSCPKWTTSMSWPGPIHEHLDALREKTVRAGDSDALSRAELLAALVYSAPKDGGALKALVDKYRLGVASDLVEPINNVVVLAMHRPGRR